MASRLVEWFTDRWPIRPVLRWSLEEEIPGGDSFWYSLGAATLFVFVIQVVTGIWQMFWYVPTADHAYQSVMYIRQEVPFGWLIHGLHAWGSNAFLVLLSLHMVRVFVWGAYKHPRQLTWLIGVFLFFTVVALSFTGALLPWDELGYWAAEVGTSIAGTVPLIGFFLKDLMRGGAAMSQATLSRFFVGHVAILPGILAALIVAHLVAFRQYGSVGPWNEEKRRKSGWFWPNQIVKDLIVIAVIFVVLVGLSAFWRAPITGPADHIDNSITPKPEWQFLFLYQFLKLFKGRWESVGTVGVPAVLFLILFLLPFYDRNERRNPLHRPLVMAGAIALLVWLWTYTYLGFVSKPGVAAAAPVSVAPSASPRVQAGATLFTSQGCIACHTVRGRGGNIGPDLSNIGAQGRSRAWLTQQIRDPKSHDPSTRMPAFDSLSDQQVKELVAYLESLGGAGNPSVSSLARPPASKPDSISSMSGPNSTPPSSRSKGREPNLPSAGEQGPPGRAAYLVGQTVHGISSLGAPMHGQLLYDRWCAKCHGSDGRDDVNNPGSARGMVPPLNPIAQSLYSKNPLVFAENIDRYIQHGSIPNGPHPEKYMPAFGGDLMLTQEMISEVEAYVLKLNGVDRAKIIHPGLAPKYFFLWTTIAFGVIGAVAVILRLLSDSSRQI
jgi:ubiquinol-cytochrome c reductase cytochrome b subunit